MQRFFLLAIILSLSAVVATPPLGAAPGGQPKKSDVKAVLVKRDGDAYCFDRTMVVGNVVVAGGRCYTFYLMRTVQGAFIALGPGGPPMIPPGQLVRLNTPAGAKLKGRLFYLIPIALPVTFIKVDEIRFVPVVVTPQTDRVVVTVPTGQGSSDREPELVFIQR